MSEDEAFDRAWNAVLGRESFVSIRNKLSIHDLRCLIREIASALAQNAPEKWQPIETAPHNENVLLFWVNSLTGKGEYEVNFASGGEVRGSYSSRWYHGSATHWRPLPPAPAPQGGE